MYIPENDFILCKSVVYTTDFPNMQVVPDCIKSIYLYKVVSPLVCLLLLSVMFVCVELFSLVCQSVTFFKNHVCSSSSSGSSSGINKVYLNKKKVL